MKKAWYPLSVLALFSLVFSFLPAYYANAEWLQTASMRTRDVFFKIRRLSTAPPARAGEVTIVSIDEESCERLNARWPWSRRVVAELVDGLRAKGARVVGLNLSFTGLEDGQDASTLELARAVREHGNVVVGATFDRENKLMKPTEAIERAARHGYLEKIVDPDFSIRRSFLLRPYTEHRRGEEGAEDVTSDTSFERSFPLELMTAASSGEASKPRFDPDLGLLTVGRPRVGVYLRGDGSHVINYLVSDEDLTVVPAWEVVQGKASDKDFRGKVAIVGLTSSLFADTHPTPLGFLPGAVIHANEYVSVFSRRNLRFMPDKLEFLLSWASGACVLLLFLQRRFWLGILGFLLATTGLFFGSQVAFARDVVLEPFVLLLGPAAGALAGILASSLKLLLENRNLESRAIRDKLTDLYKYEYLRECLEEEWKRCKHASVPVSVVMTDLDRFKNINDILGHEAGNEMIRRAGQVIQSSVRHYDIVSRYGGDEFVILLWHANLEEAKAYRQRLRGLYETMARKLDEPLLHESSISIGVATYDPKANSAYPPDAQRLVEDADKDLFLDKEVRRKPGQTTGR